MEAVLGRAACSGAVAPAAGTHFGPGDQNFDRVSLIIF